MVDLRSAQNESSLRRGRLLIFGVHQGGSFTRAFLQRAHKALSSSSSDWQGALEVLLAGGLVEPQAKELMYNYDEQEYQWLQGE